MEIESLEEIFDSPLPSELWHYTNGNSFIGIISNDEMWASHIRFMNDLKEQILALEILKERIQYIVPNFNNTNDINILEKIIKRHIEYKDTFVLSFSECKDDLNQWRGYGNKIPSYSLKLNLDNFIQKEKIKKPSDNFEDFFHSRDCVEYEPYRIMLPCLYDRKKQEYLVDYILKSSKDKLVNENNISEYGFKVAKIFRLFSPVIKHKSSEFEKEWRVVIFYERDCVSVAELKNLNEKLEEEKDEEKIEFLEQQLEILEDRLTIQKAENKEYFGFRMGASYIIPYYKFKMRDKYFTDFYIGACPDKSTVEEATKYFLSRNGYGFSDLKNKIHHTQNPYRNW